MIRLLVAFLFLGLNFYIYNHLATDAVIPERRDFDEFPTELGDWTCTPETMGEEVERELGH